jgi:hypothetical protein
MFGPIPDETKASLGLIDLGELRKKELEIPLEDAVRFACAKRERLGAVQVFYNNESYVFQRYKRDWEMDEAQYSDEEKTYCDICGALKKILKKYVFHEIDGTNPHSCIFFNLNYSNG